MDKLMDNHWILKGIALLLALMLYITINLENQPQSNLSPMSFPGSKTTDTLKNVAVSVDYNNEKYIVTGVPQEVTLTLKGQNSKIQSTKVKQQYEAYMNLTGYSVGEYDVPLQYRGVSDELAVTVQPSHAKIIIQEKVTKEFPVEVEYKNEQQMKEGYTAQEPSINTKTVKIAGAKQLIEQIAYVRTYVDLKGLDETVTKQVKVYAYDKYENKLSIEPEPSTVNVTVPVISPKKTVPIEVTKVGSLQEGVSITSLQIEPSQATIYGPKDVLDKLDALQGVEVDLSKISENTTLELPLSIPKGATIVTPEKVKITIEVEKQERKSLGAVPLKVMGLAETLNLSFLDPKNGFVTVDVIGKSSVVNKLNASQIQALINVSDLVQGEHDVAIEVSGPKDVTLEIKQQNAKVELISKG
ncbi:CdaR family protein [Bacillus sp. 165]|uniref:CdaR family protein n=1 Tax=Bacillus sp. 165 TaxID=1529117 RepID=UPI001ADB4A92|nr:CdaR family protein [Bacillus sp. 165]MBO9131410.1 YbbR-like domain-containing protein [Bacillus sp. 165]